jgi:hypothetical protein
MHCSDVGMNIVARVWRCGDRLGTISRPCVCDESCVSLVLSNPTYSSARHTRQVWVARNCCLYCRDRSRPVVGSVNVCVLIVTSLQRAWCSVSTYFDVHNAYVRPANCVFSLLQMESCKNADLMLS